MASPVNAAPSEEYYKQMRSAPLYAELSAQAETNHADHSGISAFIKTKLSESPDNHWIILQWLQDRALPQEPGRYPETFYVITYSNFLFGTAQSLEQAGHMDQAKDMYKTSYLMLRNFAALALTDVQRCADPSAGGPVMQTLQSHLARFTAIKKDFTNQDWENFTKLPLALEEKFAGRPENPGICSEGLEAMQHALKDPNHTETKVADKNVLGGTSTMVTPSTPYQPKFVSMDEWQKRRKVIRAQLAEAWVKDKAN